MRPSATGRLPVGDGHELIAGAPALAGIPGVVIHGRRDVAAPLGIAQRWLPAGRGASS